MPTRRNIILLFVTLIILILTQLITRAQDEPPAPQFLYRSDNHLILLDGYTGKQSILPFEVNEKDYFMWSPDGQYLLARLYQGENNDYCLNLYDVDKRKWVDEKPIACTVQEAVFSEDTSQVFYSTSDKTNGKLWSYSLKDKSSHEVYRTTNGNDHYPAGISDLTWSPTGSYLTFRDYNFIMGGTINSFVVLDVENEKHVYVNAPDSYYASYNPIWSPDDHWFLVTLKDEYEIFGLPSNQQGDLYLFNSDTGEEYRITYTPAESEIDILWTNDGKIAFTEVTEEKFTYTLDQAMKIEVVPSDKMITPEPVEESDVQYVSSAMVSPDPKLGVWVKQTQQSDKTYTFELVVGNVPQESSDGKFAIPISDPYEMIGWRPSDYPYPQPPSPS